MASDERVAIAGEDNPRVLTDTEKAGAFRARLAAAMQPVLQIMIEAKRSDIILSFDIGGDPPSILRVGVKKMVDL